MIAIRVYAKYSNMDEGYCYWVCCLPNVEAIPEFKNRLIGNLYDIDLLQVDHTVYLSSWVTAQSYAENHNRQYVMREDLSREEYYDRLRKLNPATEQPLPKRRLELNL